jgi:hypothetical protein
MKLYIEVSKASEDRFPGPQRICEPWHFPFCTNIPFYHDAMAVELTTKRGLQGHSQPDVS